MEEVFGSPGSATRRTGKTDKNEPESEPEPEHHDIRSYHQDEGDFLLLLFSSSSSCLSLLVRRLLQIKKKNKKKEFSFLFFFFFAISATVACRPTPERPEGEGGELMILPKGLQASGKALLGEESSS